MSDIIITFPETEHVDELRFRIFLEGSVDVDFASSDSGHIAGRHLNRADVERVYEALGRALGHGGQLAVAGLNCDDLNALPYGTVVRDGEGAPWSRRHDGAWRRHRGVMVRSTSDLFESYGPITRAYDSPWA